jgi:hypothetical protein
MIHYGKDAKKKTPDIPAIPPMPEQRTKSIAAITGNERYHFRPLCHAGTLEQATMKVAALFQQAQGDSLTFCDRIQVNNGESIFIFEKN